MSVDPMQMLEELEAEDKAEKFPDAGMTDPEEELSRLESELDTESMTPKEKMKTPEKDFMRTMAAGLLGNSGRESENITHALTGSPTKAQMKETGEVTKGMGLSAAKGVVSTGQGIKQLSLEAAEGMGIIPEGSADAYTKQTDADKAMFVSEFNKEFGDRWQFTAAEGAGVLVPILATGGLLPTAAGVAGVTAKVAPRAAPAVLAGLQTVKGQMAIGGAVGGAFGASQYVPKDEEESRLKNTIESAGFGTVMTGILNAFPALRNKFRDMLGKAVRTPQATKAVQLSERTGTEFKLAQISDDPVIKMMDRLTGATIKGERAANQIASKQINQNYKFWQKTLQSFSKGKEGFGKKVEEAFTKTLGDSSTGVGLLGARAKQAKVDFAAVDRATGNKKMIKLDNFKTKATQLINDWKHSSDPAKRRAAKEIVGILRRTSSRSGSGAREFKTNGTKMQDLLQTYGGMSKGKGRIFSDKVDPSIQKQAGAALFGKLQKDLNAAVNSGVKGAKELGIARSNYELNSKAIDALKQSALGRFFKGKDVRSANNLEKNFINMEADEIRGVMGILSKTDPTIRGRLQKFWIENQLKKAKITEGFDKQIFSPHKMLELTSGLKRDKFKAVFDTGASRRQVMDGIRATQRIIVANANASSTGGSFIQKMAGVAASMDRTFVARLGAEILAPKTVAGYVNSGEGVRLLRTLAKTNDVNVGAGILIKLNNLRKEQEKETEDNGN